MSRRAFALVLRLALASCSFGVVGCGDDDDAGTPDAALPGDGGTDGGGPGDGAPDDDASSGCRISPMRLSPSSTGLLPGQSRRVFVELSRDYCEDVVVTFTTDDAAVAAPTTPTATLLRAAGRLELEIRGEGVGDATITARVEAQGMVREATVAVSVRPDDLPACDADASGVLSPGGTLEAMGGLVAVALPEGAARADEFAVAPFEATLGCAGAEAALPEGYRALGPAITFGPTGRRFPRELPLTVPVRLALLPDGATRRHIELAYEGPSVSGRVVPVASPRLEAAGGEAKLTFEAPRFGTYRAVVRADAPTRRMREYQYRGLVGFSMGAAGTASFASQHPDLFDFVAPLGGPSEWAYLTSYIRDHHFGGFCTEAERGADETGACRAANEARTPPPREYLEHSQDFEHWYFVDEYMDPGGEFDRNSYIRLMRDLTRAYGNLMHDHSAEPTASDILPPGVPDAWASLSDREKCTMPAVIPPCDGEGPDDCAPGTGFVDDEYNPEGAYPVSTFCDGGESDLGTWDPTADQTTPVEIALFVDLPPFDGIRGPGEPIVRNAFEPYGDVGLDGTSSADEPGYDPDTNPDPAGDDYDYQYNPRGTEGNYRRDGERCGAGEPFEDLGLDGVPDTRSLDDGGFDAGEGNDCFDVSRGLARYYERNPRDVFLGLDRGALADLDFFGDGGVRDLFNFAVVTHHLLGLLPASGMPLALYNQHRALAIGTVADDAAFDVFEVPWEEVGRNAMVRYGSIDATEAEKGRGDGGHVGTGGQLQERFLSSVAWMSARWPSGDRRRTGDRLCRTGECENPHAFVVDFTAESAGRTGPVQVILPPGYFAPENAAERYPVIYFLHGYGMEPMDLGTLSLILFNAMDASTVNSARRMQKVIFVFPDGRCRGGECVRGTFYAQTPDWAPRGAKMDDFLLDVVEWADATFRTKSPEMHEYVE